MGDPKKAKKQYTTPSHPWQRDRMEQETAIRKKYGVKIKREIWKMDSLRKGFTDRAKKLIASTTPQSLVEKEQIVQRLVRLGMLDPSAKFDDILGLSIDDVMGRRLQTHVWKNGFAKTPQQARQFITHGHIMVAGKKITSPGYLVTRAEETQITFIPTSAFSDPEHAERLVKAAAPKPQPEKKEERRGGGRRNDRRKSFDKPKAEAA